jgi:hypothetical protein
MQICIREIQLICVCVRVCVCSYHNHTHRYSHLRTPQHVAIRREMQKDRKTEIKPQEKKHVVIGEKNNYRPSGSKDSSSHLVSSNGSRQLSSKDSSSHLVSSNGSRQLSSKDSSSRLVGSNGSTGKTNGATKTKLL